MMKQQKEMVEEMRSFAAALRVTNKNPTAQRNGHNPYSYFEDTDGSSEENLSYSEEEDDDETISDIEMDDIASLKSSKTTVTDYYTLDSILRSSPKYTSKARGNKKKVNFSIPSERSVIVHVKRSQAQTRSRKMIEDIVDSGATHHMRENKDDFEHISEIKDENGRYPLVELGDGS